MPTPEEEAQAIVNAADEIYQCFVSVTPETGWTGQSVRERIAAIITLHVAAALKAREATWQPIETAPKDGSPVLVGYSGVVWIDCWSDGYWEEGHPYAPTHWMPLPSPPAAAQQKGSDS